MTFLSKIPFLGKLIKKIDSFSYRLDSLSQNNEKLEIKIINLEKELIRQKHISKYKNGEKINIIFICQRPQVWTSLKSLYEACLKDSDFNVTIVTIPIKKQLPNITFNHEIYESEGAETFWADSDCNVINGYDSFSNKWLDLRTLNPDYVFFQQPYDIVRCELYKSSNIAEFASIGYTSYYYAISSDDIKNCMPENFIKNVSICFLQNNSEEKWFNDKFNILKYPTVKRFITGCPKFDNIHNYKNKKSSLWKLNTEKSFKVIWTPRWTTNENTCHFFDYKDKFIEYCKRHKDVDFIFRPHPQAKLNYAAEENFSINQFEQYEQHYKNSNNMNIDYTPDYLPLFYSADVLISDISSIIPEFFLTGKPIIFCKKNQSKYNIESVWSKGLYIAKNWSEVEHILNQLKSGIDPLYELRHKLISSEFVLSSSHVGQKMKCIIKKDFKGEL